MVLQHEIDLSSHAGVLGVLFLVGLLLAIGLVRWFRSVSLCSSQGEGTFEYSIEREWLGFLWGSVLLLITYLTLVFVVAFL